MAWHVHSGPTGDAWPGMSTLVPQGMHGLACPLWSHRGCMAWHVHSGPTGDAWPGMSTLVPQGMHGLACPLWSHRGCMAGHWLKRAAGDSKVTPARPCIPCGTRVDMPGHASPVGPEWTCQAVRPVGYCCRGDAWNLLYSLSTANSGRKLTLLYLANDIIQNSKRKGQEYKLEFTRVLPRAFQLVSK